MQTGTTVRWASCIANAWELPPLTWVGHAAIIAQIDIMFYSILLILYLSTYFTKNLITVSNRVILQQFGLFFAHVLIAKA